LALKINRGFLETYVKVNCIFMIDAK